MATRWAVATGNWSATATWNGGTLPTAADDVYSNTFTVTIDQNVTVLSLQNGATTGVTAGGGFTATAARTIDCSAGTGFIQSGAVVLLSLSGTFTWVTRGSIVSNGTVACVLLNSIGVTLSHTGSVTSNSSGIGISALGSSNVLSVIGNVAANGSGAAISGVAGTTHTIVGAVSNTSSGAGFLYSGNATACTTTITGDITSNGTGTAINMTGGGNGGGVSLIHVGKLIAISNVPAVTINGQLIKSTGPFYSSASGVMPFSTGSTLFKLTPITANELRFASSVSGTTSLYSADMTTGPTAADVRNGVSYSYSGTTTTGTLKVPNPAYVATGVQTDATVGTYNPAADVWAYAVASGVTAQARLLATSTTDSVGAIVAANAI